MGKLIKIGLCDDEAYIHKEISKIIEKYQNERKCSIEMFSFFTPRELLETEKEIQILLLDIDMPQMDGIEAAFRLKEQGRNCKIIMLTSKLERFKDAFKIGAYRFVTKPVDVKELEEALDDARSTLLGYAQTELKFGAVPCKVFQHQIDYLQACGDYVKIHVGEKVCESTRPLKSWKEELDSRLFVECHKSYVVNLKSVKRIERDSFLLENGEKILIARRRRGDVVRAFAEFDIRNGRV